MGLGKTIGIGVGILAVLGGVFYYFKKKDKGIQGTTGAGSSGGTTGGAGTTTAGTGTTGTPVAPPTPSAPQTTTDVFTQSVIDAKGWIDNTKLTALQKITLKDYVTAASERGGYSQGIITKSLATGKDARELIVRDAITKFNSANNATLSYDSLSAQMATRGRGFDGLESPEFNLETAFEN